MSNYFSDIALAGAGRIGVSARTAERRAIVQVEGAAVVHILAPMAVGAARIIACDARGAPRRGEQGEKGRQLVEPGTAAQPSGGRVGGLGVV